MKPSLRYLLRLLLLGQLCLLGTAAPLRIDPPQSRIEVSVNSTASSFVGKVEKYQISIEFDRPQTLPTKAELAFDFKDLKTGVNGRDAHMLKWLQYAKNPTATFHLTGWKQEGKEPIAQGELSIHGVRQTIQMPLVVSWLGDSCILEGATELDYRDFGLPRIRKILVFAVDPHLKVKFRLVGRLTP